MPKTTPRAETASVQPQKANVHLEMHAQSIMTRTQEGHREGTTSFHLLRQVHHTEIRKVTEKVVMTVFTHRNLLVKVRQGKRTDYFVQISRKEVAKWKIHVIFDMFPNVPRRIQVWRQMCLQTHSKIR